MSDAKAQSSDPVDKRPQLEKECHGPCEKQWRDYQACSERIKKDDTGVAHCSGWYFEYWKCVDPCVAPKIFKGLK